MLSASPLQPHEPLPAMSLGHLKSIQDISERLDIAQDWIEKLADQSEHYAGFIHSILDYIKTMKNGDWGSRIDAWMARLNSALPENFIAGVEEKATKTAKEVPRHQQQIMQIWEKKPHEILPREYYGEGWGRTTWCYVAKLAELIPSYCEGRSLLVAEVINGVNPSKASTATRYSKKVTNTDAR